MGKIGDLFVKLGLKADEYKKGIKEAEKQNQGFRSGLSKLKENAQLVWAAIGAGVAAFGKKMLETTNDIGDAWERTLAGIKGGFTQFVRAFNNMDFSNLFQNMKEARDAARNLQDVIDAQFEGHNSVNIQRALMSEELENLRLIMRDQTKSYDERLKAAENYLTKVEPIYLQEKQLADDLLDAQQDMWLATSGLTDSAKTREDLTQFLIDLGKDKTLADTITKYLKAQGVVASAQSTQGYSGYNSVGAKMVEFYRQQEAEAKAWLDEYGKSHGYATDLAALGKIYTQWRGDADTKPLVDAIIAAGNAKAAMDKETRMIQTIKNSIRAQIDKEKATTAAAAAKAEEEKLKAQAEEINKLADWANKMEAKVLTMPIKLDLEIDDATLDDDIEAEIAAYMEELDIELQQFNNDLIAKYEEIKQLNEMLEQSFISSFSGGVQALTDAAMGIEGVGFEQVMAAIMQPIASTATQLGEMLIAQGLGIAAFKESLKSLNPAIAIAAGAALVALGAALSSGIKAMGNSAGGGTTAANSASSSTAGNIESYEQDITVHVVGEISGDKIILAGQKTLNKWSR
jgi:hypothetical protein